MFRIIVISLFIANVLLAAFQVSRLPAKKKAAPRVIETEESNIPTIYLFSELQQDQDLMSGNRQCFTLGPFHDSEDLNEVRSRLAEVSLSTNERQTQALVEKGYWVFLRPYPSLLEANEALFGLHALGLQDIAVVYEGERRNSISLGYYLRQKNALKRQQELEAVGYEALVRVQRKAEPRYWLDYEQNPGSGVIDLDMQNRPNDFMQRALPCPEQPQLEAKVTESELPEPKLLQPEPLEPEPLESKPPVLEANATESEPPESAPLKSEPSTSGLPKSKPLESESLELEPPKSAPLESEPLELGLPKSGPPESELLKSGLTDSKPLESVLQKSEPLESEPLESELPKSEPPESVPLKLGPPVLEPTLETLESESPADSEAPVQTDTREERDGPESEGG